MSSEYFILSLCRFLCCTEYNHWNNFKAKDDKFDDLLDGIVLKDLFD